MIQLRKNIWLESDDSEVLSLIKKLRLRGLVFAEFDPKKNDQSLFVVEYENGFNLYFIMYSAAEKDSGYTFLLIKNFLSENKFNLNNLKVWGFHIEEALASIHMQVTGIAKRINYPFNIITVLDKDFVGLIAEVPIDN
jgi:hypothetical protein